MRKRFICLSWFVYVAVLSLVLALVIATDDGTDRALGVTLVIVAVVTIVGFVLMLPFMYKLDEEGITLYYACGVRTRARWKEIKHVERQYGPHTSPFGHYAIGYFNAKLPFHREGRIPRRRKTAKLIEKYWQGKIT